MTEALVLDFCGSRLCVTADDGHWIERMRDHFGDFASENGTGAMDEFALAIHEADAPRFAHDLPLSWEGTQPDGHWARVFEDGDLVVHEVGDDVALRIDHAAGRADALVGKSSERRLFGTAIMQILDAAFGSTGRHLVHAACLVEARSGKAVLFSVPSGGGKTTTSLALARDGFALMTDDASVLVPDGARPRVWGLPRAAKVHWRTARMLPWLGPFSDQWNKEGEQGIHLAELAGQVSLAAPEPVELGAVVHIGARVDGAHRFRPMPKGDVLVELAHENVPWRTAGMLPRALRRFQDFASSLSKVPTFELNAGPDLASLPDAVRSGLAGSLYGIETEAAR